MIRVGMVSLGCSKNQVDAERMLSVLRDSGMEIENNPRMCDVIIVNTCGFIEDAKMESIENILEFTELKKEGRLKVVAVTGCLAERYREEISLEIPEADVILGIGSNNNIVGAIKKALLGEKVFEFGEKEDLSLEGERILTNDSYFAYLKIAEGCDNHCTYCAIPSIRGPFRSRTMENIVQEAETLAKKGVSELNVVAQDSTRYGLDIYGKLMLAELLKKLAEVDGIRWIRVLYCYPENITDELIKVVGETDKIVKYFDIPLQHASNAVLTRMNRKSKVEANRLLIRKIRKEIPKAVIRTTFIAGFPGETDKQFEELCQFIEDMKFERLGCFAYSKEDGTPAEKLGGHLEEEVKQRRAEVVMEIQMKIAADFSRSMKGKELTVLVEGFDEDMGMYCARSYMDAPDVDNKVYFASKNEYGKGSYVDVVVTSSSDYDLIADVKEN